MPLDGDNRRTLEAAHAVRDWSALDLSDPPSTFVCPGETASITEAVHLQRLATGWAVCGVCRHRDEMSGMSQLRQRDIIRATSGGHRGPRRTRYGVRGVHGTQLDRQVCGGLLSIVGSHLQTSSSVADHADPKAIRTDAPTVFLGYDGRTSSLDLLPAATTALLQSGCRVVDVGRATVASTLEAARRNSAKATVVFVTGAGGSLSTAGFDVIDIDGNVVSVPWARYGLALELVDRQADNTATTPATHFCRQSIDSRRHATRHVRTSGRLSRLSIEDSYREWLQGWFIRQKPLRKVIATTDELVASRLRVSLASEQPGITQWMTLAGRDRDSDSQDPEIMPGLGQRVAETGSAFGFLISEDDRCLQVVNSHGRRISLVQLAEMINAQPEELPTHVTAHAISDENRIALIDVGRPSSGRAHEWIADACAVTGLLLSVLPV